MDNRKILLIEDNTNDVILTRRMFTKSKIANEIIAVGDGEQALKYLFEDVNECKIKNDGHDLPLVILLDLHLPKIDGIEILRKIRACEDTKLVPVIVMSTSREEDEMVIFLDFADAFRMLGLFLMVTNQPPASLSY